MDLTVLGCHGGESPKHRTCAFVLDGRVAIDAGSLTSGLDLKAQAKLEAVLVSHAHLDHVRDLAMIADNRTQANASPLLVVGTRPTIDILKRHFFNDALWPDFTKIPSRSKPTIRYQTIKLESDTEVCGYRVRAIPVAHTIDCNAFIIDPIAERGGGAIVYSGDTGPTDRLFEVINETPSIRALLMEVSFPNAEQRLATVSGHHTPQTLALDLKKLAAPKDLPTLLYHIKPVFQAQVERECARLRGLNLSVLEIGDRYRILK